MPPSDRLRFEIFRSASHPLEYINSGYPFKLATPAIITATQDQLTALNPVAPDVADVDGASQITLQSI